MCPRPCAGSCALAAVRWQLCAGSCALAAGLRWRNRTNETMHNRQTIGTTPKPFFESARGTLMDALPTASTVTAFPPGLITFTWYTKVWYEFYMVIATPTIYCFGQSVRLRALRELVIQQPGEDPGSSFLPRISLSDWCSHFTTLSFTAYSENKSHLCTVFSRWQSATARVSPCCSIEVFIHRATELHSRSLNKTTTAHNSVFGAPITTSISISGTGLWLDDIPAYRAGVTTGIVSPQLNGFLSGLNTAFSIATPHKFADGAIVQRAVAIHVSIHLGSSLRISTQTAALLHSLLDQTDGDLGEWFDVTRNGKATLVVEA
ncbi:hypothetical protein BD311DRAFT_781479 [Dichomitus squalens]|uniref:Uncharacterized protein n=1 Tax=Dichomitus squalens TaxID=114155 RepID=A0A4V2JZ58_9APHY|nr:hypothetical protein BD311DRAFT_781479 [Dichomitus squalens]